MPNSSGKPKDNELLNQLLSSNGDGTGTTNVIGDVSGGGAIELYAAPPADITYEVYAVHLQITDAGKALQEGYGAIAALTTGYQIIHKRDGVNKFILTNGTIIKINDHFVHAGADLEIIGFGGVNDTIHVHFDMVNLFGEPMVLDGSQNDRLTLTLNDNFTGLIDQSFSITGVK